MKHITILSLSLILLAGLLAPGSIIAQEGDTQTYTTGEGLTFDYPAGWTVTEEFGVVYIGNSATTLTADTLNPGDVQAFIFSGEFVAAAYGVQSEELAAAADELAASLADITQTDLSPTEIELAGETAYRMETVVEDMHLFFIMRQPDEVLTVFYAGALEQSFAEFEPELLAMAASLRYDPDAEPTGGGPVAGSLTAGEGAVAWQLQIENSEDFVSGLSELGGVATGPEGSILAHDGVNLYRVSPEGAITRRIEPSDFFIIGNLGIGPAGDIWLTDAGGSSIWRLDASGRSRGRIDAGATLTDVGTRFIPPGTTTFGPDGHFYAFLTVFEGERPEGYMTVWNGAGEQVAVFNLTDESEEGALPLFSSSVFPTFTPAGELLIVDGGSNRTRLLDAADGSVIQDNPLDLGDLDGAQINTVAMTDEGWLVLSLASGQVVVYGADGERLGEFGREQAVDETAGPEAFAFEIGELNDPLLALLPGGEAVVVDSNAAYSQILWLDLRALVE